MEMHVIDEEINKTIKENKKCMYRQLAKKNKNEKG